MNNINIEKKPFNSPEILAPAMIPVTPLNNTPNTPANDV